MHLSSVNDGLCDCCAGQAHQEGYQHAFLIFLDWTHVFFLLSTRQDEWGSDAHCPDRCDELAAAAAKSASQAMEGSRVRQALCAGEGMRRWKVVQHPVKQCRKNLQSFLHLAKITIKLICDQIRMRR